jgi:hypothetical protein
MQQIGAFAYAASTDAELAAKLQTMPGSDVDKLFLTMELLTTFRDRIGADGLLLLGQIAAFCHEVQKWMIPGQPTRIVRILNAARRDLGVSGIDQTADDDAAPILAYREDGKDYRQHVEVNLDQLKASKRKAVNSQKLDREGKVAPTPFGPVNSDADSRGKINGLVMMALLAKQAGVTFGQGFTLADDTTVQLNADQMIALGVAVGTYVSRVHGRARVLKEAIAAAETVEDVNAIDITSGWPGDPQPTPAS